MPRLRFLSTVSLLGGLAFASCGGPVDLDERPCPCSDGWTCCAEAKSPICVQNASSCPVAPKGTCQPGTAWQATADYCVLDVDVRDEDVCRNDSQPTIQVDFFGMYDACVAKDDPTKHAPFNCTTHWERTTVDGMVVFDGLQIAADARDRCRLQARLITTATP